MKTSFLSINRSLIFLFCFVTPFFTVNGTKLKLNLHTAGLNSVVIQGSIKGDFDLAESIEHIDCYFNSHNSHFRFEGNGSFISLGGTRIVNVKNLDLIQTFATNSSTYLTQASSLNILNAATLIGSLSLKPNHQRCCGRCSDLADPSKKTSFICSFFGKVDPANASIHPGRYRFKMIGRDAIGTKVFVAKAKAFVSNQ